MTAAADTLRKLKRSLPFFNDFNDEEAFAVLRAMSGRTAFEDGDILFREGTPSTQVFIILTGRVRLSITFGLSHSGAELAMLESGDVFGATGLIDAGPRWGRATAVGTTVLLILEHQKLLQITRKPVLGKLYVNLSGVLVRRIREAEERLGNIEVEEAVVRRRFKDLAAERAAEQSMVTVDLSDSNLRDLELRRADFRGSNLRGSVARDVQMGRADLRGANLRKAVFVESNLRGACFRGADLRGCTFRSANLGEANFNAAVLDDIDVLEELGAAPGELEDLQ